MTARPGRPTKSGAWVGYDVELGKVLLKPHADAPIIAYNVNEVAEIRDALGWAVVEAAAGWRAREREAAKRACTDAAADEGGVS